MVKNLGFNIGKGNKIGDTNIFKTELPNKNRADVRELRIVKEGNGLRAIAKYSDGTEGKNFDGYWYGWHIAPNSGEGVIWEFIERSNRITIPQNFTEVSVWVYPQRGKSANGNVHVGFGLMD